MQLLEKERQETTRHVRAGASTNGAKSSNFRGKPNASKRNGPKLAKGWKDYWKPGAVVYRADNGVKFGEVVRVDETVVVIDSVRGREFQLRPRFITRDNPDQCLLFRSKESGDIFGFVVPA